MELVAMPTLPISLLLSLFNVLQVTPYAMAFFKLSALVLLLISGVRAGPCESPSEDEGGNANTPSAYGWFPGYDDEVDICDVDFSYYDALSYSFVYVFSFFIPKLAFSFPSGFLQAIYRST